MNTIFKTHPKHLVKFGDQDTNELLLLLRELFSVLSRGTQNKRLTGGKPSIKTNLSGFCFLMGGWYLITYLGLDNRLRTVSSA